jgi:beta-phosphoglucomutase-like phosphatase (HAD superfamily)
VPYEAILFDFDGVLAVSEPVHFVGQATQRVIEEAMTRSRSAPAR